ncbi:hypothetical protein OSB04_019783 [Centaurea solstitialis]|uniref:Copia protein n=1 Tax=Centaurea solstitialis TaxID=347529 RepID=A0AA38T379_9ASTR|nr:hypothetical protein OSB04_019783 [Centaurea solstitialis]
MYNKGVLKPINTAVKRIFRYLKGTPNLGLWYSKDSGFDLTAYSDSDFAGCKIDRKSTTGGCHLLGGKLVSWTSKKQNSVSTSTAEAEYVAAGICCAQVLWLRNQLQDYDIQLSKIPIYCDNTSAIAIANNPVLHSKTKHIEVRCHFIRDHVMNAYSDSDFAGCKIDRKSTTGGCHLLGGKLVSWTSKKQNSVSTSTAEAEYDYDIQLSKIPIYCDNTSAIAIANNPVLHSKAKHIEVRYHFIRDHVMNGDIELHFVPTEYQLADLFTKPLDVTRFNMLISELGMLDPDE